MTVKPSRILIFRPDNIGDIVLFSGAIRHIRGLYPDAHITLAVQPHIVNLVELCPYIDACIPVSQLTWWERYHHLVPPLLKNLACPVTHNINRLWNLVGKPFDTIIYPVKSPQIHHLEIVHDLNAKKIIGITGCCVNAPAKNYPKSLNPAKLYTDSFNVSDYAPWQHEFLTTIDFLRFLGSPVSGIEEIKPEFWLSDDEINLLRDFRMICTKKIIGVFPAASDLRRYWKTENYADFAALLPERYRYAIFGSESDVILCEDVAVSIGQADRYADIINFAGKTTLRMLVKSIFSCDFFISVETSGLHIAVALGIPTVGIIGGGHYGRFVPWGNTDKTAYLTKEMDCFGCSWRLCQKQFECIQGVKPSDVANAAIKLLSNSDRG